MVWHALSLQRRIAMMSASCSCPSSPHHCMTLPTMPVTTFTVWQSLTYCAGAAALLQTTEGALTD